MRFDVVFSPFSPLSASSASLHPVGGHAGLPAEAGQGEQVTILTPRQAEVYAMLLDGQPDKRIAQRLVLQEYTVKEHVSAIFARLGVGNRRQLIRQACLPGCHTPPTHLARREPARGEAISPAQLGLTARQADVLRLLLDGAGNRGIARQLGLKEDTVKGHVTAILRALNASTRSQVMVLMRPFSLL
ncbi:helix-turn-helix domain-containing protein [Cupriavidus malaysiensis]|uniref:LuxR C-terminal-related transcriptional regulator n=1 Tax=Cupriavidus malaysiensis TaxID=367825 RepID=UPI001F3E9A41|nr:helix-turn-helix transcriptional regulator [Cupriavidus malaysiensis]